MPESSLAALIERASTTDAVLEAIRSLAEAVPAERVLELVEAADAAAEADALSTFCLVAVFHGVPLPRELLERRWADLVDARGAAAILAAQPDRLELALDLLSSRRLDRWQRTYLAYLVTSMVREPPFPAELIETLRYLARFEVLWSAEEHLLAAGLRVRDPHIDRLLGVERDGLPIPAEPVDRLFDDPKLEHILPEREKVAAAGFTARRVAPKVGRNDACPCGSGKKFKKCCANDPRRSELSPMAGMTLREYRLSLHRHLSLEELDRQAPFDLARLPFEELASDQLATCLRVFIVTGRLEDAERALVILEARDDRAALEAPLDAARLREGLALELLRQEAPLDRALAVLGDEAFEAIGDPELRARLALARTGAAGLEALEALCRDALAGGEAPRGLLPALVESAPALGIFLGRGMLDARDPAESEATLYLIEDARDHLALEPDDPYWAVLDILLEARAQTARSAEQLERAAEAKARVEQTLAAVRAEAREARQRAELLSSELDRQQSRLSELEALEEASQGDRREDARSEEEARRLRQKIRELKDRIREGQEERLELRRAAESAESSAVPEPTQAREPTEAPDEEPGEALGAEHALRVPVWSDRAAASLSDLPRHISQAAVALSGALAAGRADAWRGAKRLQGMGGLCSARVGIHHRLLFRVDEEGKLDVDEVVTRENLDKALAARR